MEYHQKVQSHSMGWYGEVAEPQRENRADQSASRPFVLNLFSMVALNVFLVLLCIGIALLWYFSRLSDGFDIHLANHYVLSYAPTAILVWVVAAWRQIDFHVKVDAPWRELYKGYSVARKSVLLDYVSVFQIAALYTAAKNKHFLVVVTTVSFVLLKLGTLASTGLFVSEPSILKQQFNGTINSTLTSRTLSLNNNTPVFDQSSLYTTYGVLVQDLLKPFGLGKGVAYSTFSAGGLPLMSNLSTEVNAFVPTFECQPATIDAAVASQNSSEVHPDVTYNIIAPSCSLASVYPKFFTLNPKSYRCPARQISGLSRNINCSTPVFGSEGGGYKLLMLADFRFEQELSLNQSEVDISNPVQAITWSTEISQVTAVVCRLSYDMQIRSISATSSNVADPTLLQPPLSGVSDQLDNFTDTDLDSLFRDAVSAGDGILGRRDDEEYALEYPDPMFKMMAAVAGGSYENLLNVSKMAQAASLVSLQLSAQIAHQYLRESASEPITLKTEVFSPRLKVTTSATWVTIGTLNCVICLGLIVSVMQERTCVIYSHENLTEVLPLLHNDDKLTTDLLDSQACTESNLSETLQNSEVHLTDRSDGSKQVLLENAPSLTMPEDTTQPWWNPITVSWIVISLTFVLAIGIIVSLEILQRNSDANSGFINLASERTNVEAIYTHFIPATVVLLVASSFNCLDFNVVLLNPFYELRNSVDIKHVHSRSSLSRIPPVALWQSIRHKTWAPTFSSVAAIVGSLMTIVVSGLYSIEVANEDLIFQLQQADRFTGLWPNSVLNDSGAALLTSLTENLDFPYPVGTYSELAFPRFELPAGILNLGNSRISLQAPAWRADLQCSVLPGANFTIQQSMPSLQNSLTVNASYSLPSTCLFGGSDGTDPFLNFVHTFNIPSDQNSSYVGKLLDIHVAQYDSVLGDSMAELNPASMSDNPLGCPSIAFIYGHADVAGAKNGIAVEVCYQQLQMAQTSFYFQDANFTLNETDPPVFNESSKQYAVLDGQNITYTSSAEKATNFQFRPQNLFDRTFAVFNSTRGNPFSTTTTLEPIVDPFVQGVFFGRLSMPPHLLDLSVTGNQNQVRNGILALYRRYMAQAISLNMRTALEPGHSPDNAQILATARTAVSVRRLVQNNVSKLLLQSMLGFMIFSGLIVLSTIRMHQLLPASSNPCTIWGQMTLWAGSRYCEGAADTNTGLFGASQSQRNSHNARFQLGWWTMSDGKRRYGIDIVDDK